MRAGQKRDFARQLRRDMTDAERHLWRYLRRRQVDGHRFRRQFPVGRYVVDFICLEAGLVVELDGGQHANSRVDTLRTGILEAAGYRVLRFWNNDALGNIEGVIAEISRVLEFARPHPSLPPQAEEGA